MRNCLKFRESRQSLLDLSRPTHRITQHAVDLLIAERQKANAYHYFLSDERKKVFAQKRGGGQTMHSLNGGLVEERYRREPATELTPEMIFDRRWALAVMEQTVARLRAEYVAADRTELFEELRHFQSGDEAGRSYAEVAARLSLSESAVKSAIYRLRKRHRALLREEISHTKSDRFNGSIEFDAGTSDRGGLHC